MNNDVVFDKMSFFFKDQRVRRSPGMMERKKMESFPAEPEVVA